MKKDLVANSTKYTVTFEVPAEIKVESVSVLGDFNNWDEAAGRMKQRKDGSWARTVRLEPGTYRFRYLADGRMWMNDPAADGYEPSGHGEDNCLLLLK